MFKVFVSYSHKDEEYKNELEEHLSTLKRNGSIITWNDRKILPGSKWADELSENLDASTVILFLISPAFLASDYCVGIEASQAITMHNSGRAILIPIIIRACDWANSNLSVFQALPKDGLPVRSATDRDNAWLEIVNGIKLVLSTFTPKEQSQSFPTPTQQIQPTTFTLAWINDTEVLFTHRRKNKLTLDDIYISPDLERRKDDNSGIVEISAAERICLKASSVIILGDEQQGKTTLLKRTFNDLLKKNQTPLYINARKINRANLEDVLKTAISTQYHDLTLDSFLSHGNSAIFIDDLHSIGLNSKFRDKLLNEINEKFSHIIITADSSFAYAIPEVAPLDSYESYNLLYFGHAKRAELVERWISLGIEESIEENHLFSECDETKSKLDDIVRKNILPAKPIFLLALLQMFEAYHQQNLELTSLGHCYQELIYQSFRNAGIKQNETGKYLNVLTELAWAIHKSGHGLNQDQVHNFFNHYETIYLKVERKQVLDKLIQNSILREVDFQVDFKYQYLYFFFVAKKIADYFHKDQAIKEEISHLLTNLHREDYANILVFVTHHTKDDWILDEIQKTLQSLFSDQKRATIYREQVAFMDEFIAKIPKLILEQREIRTERHRLNQELDEADKLDLQLDQHDEHADMLANINKTFKGIEIAGQIVRNRHASLARESLYALVNEGVGTGLRFLEFFLKMSEIAKIEVIKIIAKNLRENPTLSNEEILSTAEKTFLHLTFGVINAVIKRVASSIGSKEANEIYALLETNEPTPAINLINFAIDLHFNKKLDINRLKKTHDNFSKNPVCLRILTEMTIQHTYMFPVGYKEKQQIKGILGISEKTQHQMDLKKKAKG